jgi:protein TonB
MARITAKLNSNDAIPAVLMTAIIFLALPYANLTKKNPETHLNSMTIIREPLPTIQHMPTTTKSPPQKKIIPKPTISTPVKPNIPLKAITDFNFNLTTPAPDLNLNFSTKPTAPTDSSSILDIASVDQAPRPIVQLNPIYPIRARMRGIEGLVHTEFIVTDSGKTKDIRIIGATPPKIFNRAARHAIECWRFSPATLNNNPVPVIMRQTIKFEIK